MYFKEKNENRESINILPMIDIIFAILSFFIISSLYLTRIDSIKVNLPKSSTAVREQNKPQIITVDSNERIYFNSNEISLKNIDTIIRTNIENLEEPIVILRADTPCLTEVSALKITRGFSRFSKFFRINADIFSKEISFDLK